EWLNIQALRNVKESMAHPCENQSDYRARADTISKAKDVVIGKSPDTAIQINNQNHKPTYESEYLKRIQANFER
ncbi:MAG: hypothetical protein M0Z78_05910, partial [Betaproteobacteria bacterium]|nr:hypothetical protein [Betaproteobacteria bacterium]